MSSSAFELIFGNLFLKSSEHINVALLDVWGIEHGTSVLRVWRLDHYTITQILQAHVYELLFGILPLKMSKHTNVELLDVWGIEHGTSVLRVWWLDHYTITQILQAHVYEFLFGILPLKMSKHTKLVLLHVWGIEHGTSVLRVWWLDHYTITQTLQAYANELLFGILFLKMSKHTNVALVDVWGI